MKRVLLIPGALLLVALVFFLHVWQRPMTVPALPKGVPVSVIANGKTLPRIGLVTPLPRRVPLPADGTVIGAAAYPPQRPYGAAAAVMLKLNVPAETFVAAYRKRLADAGFSFRRIPVPPNLDVDAAYAAYEADDPKSGNTVYVTIRSASSPHYAQLTFWNPPAPRR